MVSVSRRLLMLSLLLSMWLLFAGIVPANGQDSSDESPATNSSQEFTSARTSGQGPGQERLDILCAVNS